MSCLLHLMSMTQPDSFAYSISYVAHRYKMHFGAGCRTSVLICPCKQHHDFYAASSPLTMVNEGWFSLRCRWVVPTDIVQVWNEVNDPKNKYFMHNKSVSFNKKRFLAHSDVTKPGTLMRNERAK